MNLASILRHFDLQHGETLIVREFTKELISLAGFGIWASQGPEELTWTKQISPAVFRRTKQTTSVTVFPYHLHLVPGRVSVFSWAVLLEQFRLVFANLLGAQTVWRTVEASREIFHYTDVTAYGSFSVIATLEFLQHHFSEMGHGDTSCDPHLHQTVEQPTLHYLMRVRRRAAARPINSSKKRRQKRLNAAFLSRPTCGRSGLTRASTTPR
jgi:hypothetical protein